MTDEQICFASASEIAELVRSKAASPVEVLEAFLRRIERLDPAINAFCVVAHEQARSAARRWVRSTASRSRSRT